MSLPVFDHCPPELASRTGLLKLGLRPGAQVAVWRYYARGRGQRGWQSVPLYRVSEAAPPTPEQVSAEREARRAAGQQRRAAREARTEGALHSYRQDHAAALAKFRDWATRPDVVVLDTETTGLKGHAIEIGVCRVGGEVLFDTLVKNAEPIEPGALRVHGITEERLTTAPSFRWVAPQLRDVLAGQTVCIFNAEFDYAVLRRTRREQGFPRPVLPRSQTACVMLAYAVLAGDYDPEEQGYRLVSLARAAAAMGVARQGEAHRALGDALTTAALIRAVAARDWPVPETAPAGLLEDFREG